MFKTHLTADKVRNILIYGSNFCVVTHRSYEL